MSDKQVPLVIYHYPCQDGFTAAWACWKAHPDWEFYPAKHGDPPPDVTDRMVYMLDFSYKRPVMLELSAKASMMFVLDHHKTAQEDLAEPVPFHVKFDMEKSGARLAWEFFNPDSDHVPDVIKYVEDRDLWRFKYPETKAVTAYIFSLDYKFEEWDALEYCTVGEVELAGNAILQKQAKDVAELCQGKFKYIIGGHEVWCVNVPYTLASDTGHLLGKGEPFAASFYYDGAGFVFSLRSDDNGLDVSEIAKKYGGGGHKHAAGFKIRKQMFVHGDV